MRFDGTLKSWNAERGFGFIMPRQGGQDVFVHVTAFPRDGRAPVEGEVLTFEVETTAEGKKRAVRVQRPGQMSAADTPVRRPRPRAPAGGGSGLGRALLVLAIVAGLGWYAYGQYAQRGAVQSSSAPPPQGASEMPQSTVGFRCDGRTYCSQMTSCAEAKFFLKNCPGVQMDGNRDGVPCEQQWCTSPFAQ